MPAVIAEAAKARVERRLGRRVATQILPRGSFYRAEEYHQDYRKIWSAIASTAGIAAAMRGWSRCGARALNR